MKEWIVLKYTFFFSKRDEVVTGLYCLYLKKDVLAFHYYFLRPNRMDQSTPATGPSVQGKGDTGVSVPQRTPKAAQNLSELSPVSSPRSLGLRSWIRDLCTKTTRQPGRTATC